MRKALPWEFTKNGEKSNSRKKGGLDEKEVSF